MHMSVFGRVSRVFYLPFIVQTRGLLNIGEKATDLLFALVSKRVNKSVFGGQIIQTGKNVVKINLFERCSSRLFVRADESNAFETVTRGFAVSHETNNFYLDSRFNVMEAREVTKEEAIENTTQEITEEDTSKTTSRDTTGTTDNEGAGTGKRKSEEGEEPEKGVRGKRRRGCGGKKQKPGERYVPPPQKRNPVVGFVQEHFDETSYYFEGGLRKVHPYYYDFKTYCKGRWIGKSLQEVFNSEFRAETPEYYKAAAKAGRIRLNEDPVDDLSITLRNNDHLRNTVHRHEPPVVGRPLEVLVDDGEVLVVDKPASMPVHPCGRFRHNTVIFILGKERGVSGLHTVHRLDRLTSGVLLFARSLEVSKRLDQLVRDRLMEKEYVCRVEGQFPEGDVVCEEPILVVSCKVGLCRVDPRGKDSRTVFRRLSYNGSTSVVRCRPLTGRTHQIRVHLQFLGFPIVRDPVYGSSAWGPDRAKGGLVGLSDEELLKALVEEHRVKESLHLLDISEDAASSLLGVEVNGKHTDSGECASQTQRDGNDVSTETVAKPPQACKPVSDDAAAAASSVSTGGQRGPAPSGPCDTDPLCSECKIFRADPTEKDLIMYLHALSYKGPDFEYQTRLPDWATEDWVEDLSSTVH